MKRRLRAFAALLLAAAVASFSGCAHPPVSINSIWTSGRLSLKVDAGAARPAQNISAGFELAGDADQGVLKLLSPLGTQMAVARWSAEGAVIVTSDGEQRFATLDDLSRQALGEVLPLAALPDWLAGRAWVRAPYDTLPDGFWQLGWQVNTQRRSEGWIEARRTDPPAVLLRVKLDP